MVNINIPFFGCSTPVELPALPIGALVIATYNLLSEAADLAQPSDITVYDSQFLSLQFPPDRASMTAVTRWALRFGGVLSSELHEDLIGGAKTMCRVDFHYYGVEVCAFAEVPA
jgi:hypothetical protein